MVNRGDVEFRAVVPLLPAGPNLAEGLAFLTEQLGFECLWQGSGHAGVRRGDVAFTLVESTDRHWADNASCGIAINDLDKAYDELRNIPARVGPLEIKVWGRREFHVILPSGVCFQFFQSG